MVIIEYSIRRITSVIEEIDRLKQVEFPYKSSKIALQILERRFKDHLKSIKDFKKVPQTIFVANNQCEISLNEIYLYLPILGFILRSTSVRNAFETYGPLLRLARKILGSNTMLILSSEWENSPFIYLRIPILPDFVLIGLPAQESENPLLLPLTGHELGHSVWKVNNMESKYMTLIEDKIIKEITTTYWEDYHSIFPQVKQDTLRDSPYRSTWNPVYELAKHQMEEIFCDLIGLRIFAESYLYAISYILAPRVPGQRSLHYPNIKRRIAHLEEGAREFDVDIPSEFSDSFMDNEEPPDQTLKLFVELADITSASFVPDLIKTVKSISGEKEIPERSKEQVENCVKRYFKNLVPISDAKSLSDILNAAWLCFHNESIWGRKQKIKSQDRIRLLNELVLKSIEVFEIDERLR